MAYSFQTFSVNQILTSSQMNQVEVNIRDHAHGSAGVNQTVGAAPTSSGHYVNMGYNDQFFKGQFENGLRFVRGRIDTTSVTANSGPTILTGSGFSVIRSATGVIAITFTTSFGENPTVLIGPERATGANIPTTFCESTPNAPTWGRIVLLRYLTDISAAQDGPVNFTAFGKP